MVASQVMDELNVKTIDTESSFHTFRIQLNLPHVGPRFGQQIGAIRQALASADPQAILNQWLSRDPVKVGEFTLDTNDILVEAEGTPGIFVEQESVVGLIVGIDTALTPELEMEGLARELVHRLQNLRRSAGLEIADRITTYISGVDDRMRRVLERHGAYIRQETLSVELLLEQPPADDAYAEQQEVEGIALTLAVRKA